MVTHLCLLSFPVGMLQCWWRRFNPVVLWSQHLGSHVPQGHFPEPCSEAHGSLTCRAPARAGSCTASIPSPEKETGKTDWFSCTWNQLSSVIPAEKPGQGTYISTIQTLSKS